MFDVIFVGTSRGQLLKAVNSLAPKTTASTRTVIIEEIEVADPSIHTWLFHPLLPQVAPDLLIKSVTVVRTAKGSGHVLVTTADQVNNVSDAQDSQILLEQKKAKNVCLPDPLVRPLPVRQGENLRSVCRPSGKTCSFD